MSFEQNKEDFLFHHPVYRNAYYTDAEDANGSSIPDFLLACQMLLETGIETSEHKRVLISIPDTTCSVFPLLVYKCIENIKFRQDYSDDLWDRFAPGQTLKLRFDAPSSAGHRQTRNAAYCRIEAKADTELVLTDKNSNEFSVEKAQACFFEIVSDRTHLSTETQTLLAIEDANRLCPRGSSNVRKAKSVLKRSMLFLCDNSELCQDSEGLNLNTGGFYDDFLYKISDLLIIAKLTREGEYNDIDYQNTIPAIVWSEHLTALTIWLQNHPVEAIYISPNKFEEFSSAAPYLYRMLESMCVERNIPIIAFSRTDQARSEKSLTQEIAFDKLWQWSPDALKLLPRITEHYQPSMDERAPKSIDRLIDTAFVLNILAYVGSLEKLTESLNAINDPQKRNSNFELYMLLSNACSIITRSCFDKEIVRSRLENLQLDIQNHCKRLKKDSAFLHDAECVSNLITLFLNEENIKEKAVKASLKDLCSENRRKHIALIVHDSVIESARDYFEGCFVDSLNLSDRNRPHLYVNNFDEFVCDYRNSNYDAVVLTHFPGRYRMIELLTLMPTADILLAFYDIEYEWCSGLIKSLKNPGGCFSPVESPIGQRIFGDRIQSDFGQIEKHIIDDEEHIETDDYSNLFGSFDYWRSVRTTAGSSSSGSDDSDATVVVSCKELFFTDDSWMWCMQDQKVISITELVRGQQKSAILKRASEVCRNDIIIVRETGNDIIKEIADTILGEYKSEHLREYVTTWISLLNQAVDMLSKNGMVPVDLVLEKMHDAFQNKGGSVGLQQLKNWYLGKTMHPSNQSDLRAILEVICDILPQDQTATGCLKDYEMVFQAGEYIERIHQHEAPKRIKKAIKDSSEQLLKLFNSPEKSGEIEGVGRIVLLIVDEINDCRQPKNKMMKVYK